MDHDIILKSIFSTSLIIMYSMVILTQKPDASVLATIVSAFTNTLVGVFAYNWGIRKRKK